MSPRRTVPLALLTGLLLACAPARAAAEELLVTRLEASSYSLPNVVASSEWNVADDGVLLAEHPYPDLLMPWRSAVNGSGARAEIEYGLRLFFDRGFPAGTHEDWALVWQDGKQIDARGKDGDEDGFLQHGAFSFPVPLHYASPIRRYKLHVTLKVKNRVTSNLLLKPAQHEELATERSFLVALRPRWKESRHQALALQQAQLAAYGRVRGLRAWLEYAADARRAARTPEDAGRFDAPAIVSVLRRLESVAAREPADPEVRDAARTLVVEAGKLSGTLEHPDGPAVSVPSGSGQYGLVSGQLAARATELTTSGVSSLAYLKTFNASAEAVELTPSLEKLLDAVGKELRALEYLWMVQSASDLAEFLTRYRNAMVEQLRLVTALGRRLERELGRDYKARAWSRVELSPLFLRRVPKRAPGNRAQLASVVRTVYQGLYYFLKAERWQLVVLARGTGQGLAPVKDLESYELPDFDSGLPDYPADLSVMPEYTAGTVEAGGLLSFPLVVSHSGKRPREIRIGYSHLALPGGWHRKLSATSFTLRPGESRRVTYSVATPASALEPENLKTVLRFSYSDQPENAHHVAFLTRVSVEGRLLDVMGPDWEQPDSLRVEGLPAPHGLILPGGVATYRFMVSHDGYSRRAVRARVATAVPDGFFAVVSPERLVLEPGKAQEVLLKVTAPLTVKQSQHLPWKVAFAYEGELTDPSRVVTLAAGTALLVPRPVPVINGGQVVTYHLPPGATTHHLVVENRGNEAESFDFEVEEPAEGWFLDFPLNNLTISPDHPRALLDFTASAPRFAEAGSFVHVKLKMTSANHPEITTSALLTLVKDGADQVLLTGPEGRILISPGQHKPVTFLARNRAEEPVELGFRADPRNPLPEALWFDDVPVMSLQPESELVMEGTVRLPDGLKFHPGQIVPVGIAGFDKLGGKIVGAVAELVVAPRHAVDLQLFPADVTRSRGLFIGRLTLTNLGTESEEFALLLSGKRRHWGRLSNNRITAGAGRHAHVTLYVRVPPGVQPGQEAFLEVQAKSVTNSAARAFVRVDVTP